MKAILLAAGTGSRISRNIKSVPKSTLEINHIPLIRRNVIMLLEKGIEVIVCVGYQKELIYEALCGLDVKYYYNPFFKVTNSIASLWFAKEELNDDVLIINADVYFGENILESIISDNRDCVLMSDRKRIEEGDYFFKLKQGCIYKYGKELPVEERSCEYVGIGKVKASFIEKFKDRMNLLIESGKYDLWWENIIYSIADEESIETLDVDGEFWAEIDYFYDYERILSHIHKGAIRQ